MVNGLLIMVGKEDGLVVIDNNGSGIGSQVEKRKEMEDRCERY